MPIGKSATAKKRNEFGRQLRREALSKVVDDAGHSHGPDGKFDGGEGGAAASTEVAEYDASGKETQHKELLAKVLAKNLRDRAALEEPSVTEAMRTLEGDGSHLEGLDFKLKSEGSLARKIGTDSLEYGTTPDKAASEIRDALRYTLNVPAERYTSAVQEKLAALDAKGFKLEAERNFWAPGALYQGVNCNLKTPSGHVIELQFHTDDSFHMKDKVNHVMYEEWRLDDTSKPRKAELAAKMSENQKKVPVPPGIYSLRRRIFVGQDRYEWKKALALDLLDLDLKKRFDPDQPRGEGGRWTQGFRDLSEKPLPGSGGHAPIAMLGGAEPKQRKEDVPLSSIVTTQQFINMDKVKSMAERDPSKLSEPILLDTGDGKRYVLDGHHRVAYAAFKGEKTIRGRVIYLAAPGTDTSGKPVPQHLVRAVGAGDLAKGAPDQERDDHGRWSSDAAAETETRSAEVNKPFIAYRLGRAGNTSLSSENAGNAAGVAAHLARIDDYEKPASPHGDTLHAYEVTATKDFGEYKQVRDGTEGVSSQPAGEQRVGRDMKSGIAWYSFPKDAGVSYHYKHLASVPLADVRTRLKQAGHYDFDSSGATIGGKVISQAFKDIHGLDDKS